jgi:hypothetical protein
VKSCYCINPEAFQRLETILTGFFTKTKQACC